MSQQYRQAVSVVVLLAVILLAAPFVATSSQGANESNAESTTASLSETAATSTALPSATTPPQATPAIDLWERATRPAFPHAEVVHVAQVAEPYPAEEREPRPEAVLIIENWIDQLSGDSVVRQRDPAGIQRQLTVKQGLTVSEYRADSPSFSSLHVTTMLSEDDPNLPDPTDHLNLFRSTLAQGQDEIERRGGEVTVNASFDDRPAVKLVTPFRGESGEILGRLTVYFDQQTLYPLAIIGPDGRGQSFTYPTIETLSRDEVPEGTFTPQIPEAKYTYMRERFSPEAAAQSTEYPIRWLGESFSGYTLQFIERNRTITPSDDMTDNDTVTAFYLTDPKNHQDQLQIISEPRLTDFEWAHRDAGHNVHGFQQLEIRGDRTWTQPGQGYVEIDFPDSWVSLRAPTDELALTAAKAVEPLNDVGSNAGS